MTSSTTSSDARARLLEAAGPIFARDGYEAASVHDIGRVAGMKASGINYHFKSKELLYLEVVRSAYRACLERTPLPGWPDGTPAPRRLRGFIHNFLTRVVLDHEPAWHAQLIMRELFQPTPACQVLVEEFIRPNFQILVTILGDLLPKETPRGKRQQIAFSVVGQCLHYRLSRPIIHMLTGQERYTADDVEKLTEHITSFTLAGLEIHEEPRP